MNLHLRKELSKIAFLTSFGFSLAKNEKMARTFGLLGLGLSVFPSRPFFYRKKSVVITGGSRGLGFALAEELMKHEANVTLLARDQEELERAKAQLEGSSSLRVLTLVCDVTKPESIRESFASVIQHFGKIDVLINNAGSVTAGPFEAMKVEDFEAQMNLHFYAAYNTIQEVLPHFKAKNEGRIVNISSIGGKIPVPHMIPYCTSKFALSGFSQALSAELRKDGIQVTTVYPGLMRTGSPIQGVFKGDSQKEFAWFAISDSTPGLSVPVQKAAREILESVQAGETELVISLPAKIGTFVYTNFPQIFTATMGLANRFLPQDFTDQRKTGAQVRGWIDGKSWAQPFLMLMGRAQKNYNEREKFDPEYNLNLTSLNPHR